LTVARRGEEAMAERSSRGVAALFLGVLLAAPGVGCARGRTSDAARVSVKARVVSVMSRKVQRNVEAVGSLFPFEEVTVSSEVDGRVDGVYVDVGDGVSRGQPLVTILPVELRLTLDEQRAALRQIEARLAPVDGGGAPGKSGDAAEVKRAEADRTDAQQKFQRAKELYAEGLIARGTYDETEARYNAARAAYDMAVQNVQNLEAQAAERTASVALADKKVKDTVIRAPFAGHVKQRMVSPGQYVKVQTPVMVVVDTDPVRVRLKVPEKMAGWVTVDQPVQVRVEAYPDQVFLGKISRVNPSVETDTRSFEVEALLANADGRLKPGFFARARIASSHVDSALLVPRESLRYLYGAYKVYAVEETRLRETEVKLGAQEGDQAEIVDGLKDGARVAVPIEGEELRDGATVTAVP
jgi:multidrug efflux pump subunit AcrA (membrane-fusion protein)